MQDKAARKRAKAESLQNEWNKETRVHKMDLGAGGSRKIVVDAEGVDVIIPIIVDSILDDGAIVDESGT